MNSNNTTIIICCAGMGTRLGIGTTKALINICDKPLIIRMLDELTEYDDIRLVIGFQASKVISIVSKYRKDIMYAFNNDYEKNGPAASMWKGLKNARENVIIMDGDLVIEPNSFHEFLNYQGECIPYTVIDSDEPVYLNIENEKVISFSNKKTSYIWPGLLKIKKDRIAPGENYIYETIEKELPIKAIEIKCMEVDTQDDYERVIDWTKNNYGGSKNE